MKFDIIIPVAFAEAIFLEKTLPYISKNILGINRIYVITSKRNFPVLEKVQKKYNCVVLDENDLIENLNFSSVRNLMIAKYGKEFKVGWYFQQFLKLGFALSEYASDYYLSWDADTIPLKKISFFDEEMHPILDKKNEYHEPYFDTIQNLLGINKNANFSFIAEHMLFKTSIVRELLFDILQGPADGWTWFEKIINATVQKNQDSIFLFSEFETYGTYCYHKYPHFYKERVLNSFRKGGLICGRFIEMKKKFLREISFDIDIISFEIYDNPMFPYNMMHWAYKKYLRYLYKFS